VQAQVNFDQRAALQPTVDRVFESMTYSPPDDIISAAEVGLQPGMTAPDFTLDLLTGGEASLVDYRGKVVLMNMWATWCGPCHREAPDMQTLYEAYDGRFEILAVNIGETRYDAQGFVDQYRLTFPVLLDPGEQVARQFELYAYPTTYVIGRDGVVLEVIVGSFSEQGLRDVLALYVGR
jgi:peroxiredoxin